MQLPRSLLAMGLALFSHVLLSAAERPPAKVLFDADFESPHPLVGWGTRAAGITVEAGRTGASVLVSRPVADGPGTTIISTALAVEPLRGCRVRCEARVRSVQVAQPPKTWNGIKFMLHTVSPSQGERWEQQNNVFGSFDWRTLRFTSSVPDDVSRAELMIGLEDTTGQAWFDDLKVTLLQDPRDAPELPARLGPVFRGHAESRLRGAMVHPDITAESLRVLGAEWKANLLRWQLVRHVAPGGETSLAEYDSWLEGELRKLDRLLPACAEYGLRVVIDLHSPPGGARTVSGYIGSDTGLFTNALAQAKFVAVWQKIAQRYRDHPTVWGYDLANEPVEEEVGDDCDDWPRLATRAARAIREIDPSRAIMVEPTPWGGPGAIRNLDPLPVEGIIYSVHMYLPHQFTHQGIQGNAAGLRYPGSLAGRHYDKAALRRELQPVIDFQRRHHVHIFLGEFSAIRWAPGAEDYLRDCIELFEENGWDWTYHAFREYHGWSVEHSEDPNDAKPADAPTGRQRVLLEWFGRNTTR